MAPEPVVWVLPVQLAPSKEDGLAVGQASSSSGLGRKGGYLMVIAPGSIPKPQKLRGGQRKEDTDL